MSEDLIAVAIASRRRCRSSPATMSPMPPPLPLIPRELPDPVAPAVLAQPPRLARALRPELVRVAVAVGLTLYLVRALSPAHYGVFVLAGSIAGLAGYPVVEALGLGIARLLSDRPSSPERVRRATAIALRVALPIAVVLGLAVAAAAGTIARAYGLPALALAASLGRAGDRRRLRAALPAGRGRRSAGREALPVRS